MQPDYFSHPISFNHQPCQRPIDLHAAFFHLQVWLSIVLTCFIMLLSSVPVGPFYKPMFTFANGWMINIFEAYVAETFSRTSGERPVRGLNCVTAMVVEMSE